MSATIAKVIWDIHCSRHRSRRTYFCCFPLAFTHIRPWPLMPFDLSIFFEEQWTENHPQYLSGLSCALFPTTFLEIAMWCIEWLNSLNTLTEHNESTSTWFRLTEQHDRGHVTANKFRGHTYIHYIHTCLFKLIYNYINLKGRV